MLKIYDFFIYWKTEIDQFRRHDICKYFDIRNSEWIDMSTRELMFQ
jgi:hypothetical protein